MKLVNPLTKSEYYMYKVKAEDKIPADAENEIKEDKKMKKHGILGYVLALGAGAVAGGAAVVKILAKRSEETVSDSEDNSSEFEAEEEIEAGADDIPTSDEEG